MFIEKFIKNTIIDLINKVLSKNKKRIDANDYNKYEKIFLNEYLVYDKDCFEFLKLMYQTEYGKEIEITRHPISLDKIQIIQDFKCLSTFSPFESPITMTKLVSDRNKRGKQLLNDLRSFRKRYNLIYENLEDYII